MDQADTNRKTGDGHISSHCSHSLLADCSGFRKAVEDREKVHWEPPSRFKPGLAKSEEKSNFPRKGNTVQTT